MSGGSEPRPWMPHEVALARGRAATLLGEVLRGVVDAPQREALAGFLPDRDLERRELVAAHYAMFDRGVFPHESVFVADEVLIGGPPVDAVRRSFARMGLSGSIGAVDDPDHLGVELAALGFLGLAEADAIEDGAEGEAERMRDLQRELLDEHLLRWWPALVASLPDAAPEGAEGAWWLALSRLAAELVAEWRTALGPVVTWSPSSVAPPPLDDPKTDLRIMVDHLVVPSRSGWFLTPAALTRIGREASIPRGFGGRRETLTRLLRAAGQFEAVPEVVARLADHAEVVEARLAQGPLAPWSGPWRERLAITRAWLRGWWDRSHQLNAQPVRPSAVQETRP